MFLKTELLTYQGKDYYLYRKIKDNAINPDDINDLKEYWKCDIVIRQTYRQTNEVFLLFLIEIVEAKIVD
jgi:hypothetical protein